MRGRFFRILIGAAFVTFVAAGPAAPESYRPPDDPKLVVGPPLDPRGAYVNWRRVGVLRGGNRKCPPAPPGWRQESLLDLKPYTKPDLYIYSRQVPDTLDRQVSPRDQALLRKLGLDRFCAYTAETDPPEPYQDPPGLKTVKDRMAVSISGPPEPLHQQVAPALIRQFQEQTGASSLRLQQGQEPTVRITFIDSEPTGDLWPFQARAGSQHGHTLMHLARELVCSSASGPPCAATLRSHRALNYRSVAPFESTPDGHGGFAGTILELANAISKEVLDWKPEGSVKHLILNLSLGWDGEGLGDLKSRDPSVRAVHEALRFAAQKGVLVIAAAGNRRGGTPGSRLPILPAAWELRSPSAWPWPFAWCHKLVYAVGGVDWQGLPLSNARRGGFPRRVAYGDHAVAEVAGHPTRIYTGSSVSTAVVSATAAVVWHLRPDLRPDQVMKLIDRSGKDLPARADFYPWRHILPPPPTQRVSLCDAVRSACKPGSGPCPRLAELPSCPPWKPVHSDLGSLFPGDAAEPLTTYKPANPPPSFIPPCDGSTRLLNKVDQVPAAPCPTDQFSSVTSQPWVLPQPGDDPCPGCMLFPPPPHAFIVASSSPFTSKLLAEEDYSYTLKFELAPSISADARIVSATLDIDRFVDGRFKRMTYPLGLDFTPGILQTMGGFGDGKPLNDCRAQINFVVEKIDGTQMSVQNPVVIDPDLYLPDARASGAPSPAGALNGPGR